MKKFEINLAQAAALMLFGLMLILFGFHDLDSAQNWRWSNCVNERYGAPPIIDCTIFGGCVNNSDQYSIGVELLFAGLYIIIYGAYLFGRKLENLESGLIDKL
jgi:hypothetical protein